MNVLIEITDPCALCGYQVRGAVSHAVRINKRSMRTTGIGIGAVPPFCPECHWPTAGPSRQARLVLSVDSARDVRLERERKWPELRTGVELP